MTRIGGTWARALLAAMLVLMVLAFVQGFEQPGKTPRQIVLLIGAPFLLALSLRSTGGRPGALFLGLLGLSALSGVCGVALASPAERMAVLRDLAVTLSPWIVAVCAALLSSAEEDADALDTWTEVAVILSLVPLGLLGLAQAWFGWTGIDQSQPPGGTFVNRNVAAQSLVVLIPLTVPPLLAGRSRWTGWLAALSGGLGVAFLIATRSRGAWLGFALGGAVAAAVWATVAGKGRLRPGWGPVALAVGLGGAALFVPVSGPARALPSVKGTLGTLALATEGSGEVRLAIWRNTLDLVAGSPWFGIGAGRFEVEYPRFQAARTPTLRFGLESQPDHAHDDPLELVATLGIPAGTLIVVLLAGAVVRSVRQAERAGTPRDGLRSAARVAAVTGVLIHGLVSFPLHSPASAFLTWLLVGRCWASPGRNSASPGTRRLLAGLALAVVPLALWVGWQELRNQALLSEAVREVRADRCESAIAKAKEATARAPWKRRETGMAAMIHFHCETDPERSLAILEPALAIHPHQLNLLLAVGARRLKSQRPAEAESAFLHSVEIAPTLARGWLGLAMSRLPLGDREGASEACARAVDLDGDFTPARAFCSGNGLVRPPDSGAAPAGPR